MLRKTTLATNSQLFTAGRYLDDLIDPFVLWKLQVILLGDGGSDEPWDVSAEDSWGLSGQRMELAPKSGLWWTSLDIPG